MKSSPPLEKFIQLRLLDEVHDEVDAKFLDEDEVHRDDERVVHLVQDLLLQMQVLQGVVLNHNVFADAFHGVEDLCVLVLNKENLAKSALSNDVDVLEVL